MKSTKGQAIVEFALVIPIFAMILFGIVDFGRAFHTHLAIDHASREAAREASVGGTDVVNTAINSVSGVTLDASNVNVSSDEDYVTVTITYSYDFLTPIVSNIADSITLENSTVMRLEK